MTSTKTPCFFKNEVGSSLLEITVALGLLSFLCLAVGEVTNKSVMAQRTVNGADTFDQILSAAGLLMLSDANCSQTLAGQNFNPTSASGSSITLNLPTGVPLVSAGMLTTDNSIKFTSVQLTPVSSLPTQTVAFGGASTVMAVTFANLTLSGQRQGKFLGSPQIVGAVSNIPVATSPDNVIRYCAGITNSSSYDICTSQPTSPNTPVLCNSGAFSAPTITCLSGSTCP